MRRQADFAAAEFACRNSCKRAVIYVCSWGCCHGFVKLAKEQKRRGIAVEYAVFCDPVYYRWGRWWRGLFRGTLNPPIVIPDNVQKVSWFIQRQNVPQAVGELEPADSETVVVKPVLLHCDHAYMDESPEFQKLCLEVAKKF